MRDTEPTPPRHPLRTAVATTTRHLLHIVLIIVTILFVVPSLKDRYFPEDAQRIRQLLLSTPFDDCELAIQIRHYGGLRLLAVQTGRGTIGAGLDPASMMRSEPEDRGATQWRPLGSPFADDHHVSIVTDPALTRIIQIEFEACGPVTTEVRTPCPAPQTVLTCHAASVEGRFFPERLFR